MIGATAEAIDKAEDRKLFREAMQRIGLDTPRSHQVKTLSDAFAALNDIGLPAIIRPSFTLGGTGGGIAYNKTEFIEIVERGIDASPTSEVLIEESVLGWKEFEMEVVRDRNDNCIIICSIENLDPMGVHTGDSITIAPALTLTDKEYQIMRDASIAVLREIGVETGGSNVQFAINPADGRLVIIEMNPRVSRSSALASKATGFPIAKVAAKLAVGYTLDEIANDITGGATPASFEPTIDYVVTKIPRFAFEKFPGADATLTTSMKSVGEAMAIGRTFQESLQKALRSLETGLTGLDEITIEGLGQGDDKNAIRAALGSPSQDGLLKVAQAMRLGFSDEDIHAACKVDPWFLAQVRGIIDTEAEIRAKGLPKTAGALRRLKAMGFSDARLGKLSNHSADEVTKRRRALDVRPLFKRIDTCAAEFASPTAYMYSTYETPFAGVPANEARPSDKKKVVILGGGPNRIGQGIEFDYCCCHACFALAEAGFETIMINCNPETVSTDYDTSDRLYFEPLTVEDVLEILHVEASRGELVGVIVQFGGQTPLKLAAALAKEGIKILGTSPDAIDLAEDRERFARLVDRLGLRQPANGIARSREEAIKVAERIGYPVLTRPSYVLGGRAMEIIDGPAQLADYIETAVQVSGDSPVLIDQYLRDAIEVDVDAIADGRDVVIAGVMQHIEEAGVHSGDSACSLPPYSLEPEIVAEIERQARALATALKVKGLMNVQFAVKDGIVYLIEVNPRASRTVPFVAKTIGTPIAKIAARVMAGERLADLPAIPRKVPHIAVKEAVFPFARFPGIDPVLSPEMKSTGEVMGIAGDFDTAFLKSQQGGGIELPDGGTLFVSVKNSDKPAVTEPVRRLIELGFRVVATGGTAEHLSAEGLAVERVNKVAQGRPHIVDKIKDGEIDLVFNTTEGWQSHRDSASIRASAVSQRVPYFTTAASSAAVVSAIAARRERSLEVRSLQDYYSASEPSS
jgi:carbamoyl-phosphate synthase large subunit